MKSSQIQPETYRLWARQLRREFVNITWHYGLSLPTPTFEISDSRTRYGSWKPSLEIIEISEELIKKFSWDTVINVLKHEMAHQICSTIFHEPHAGHGALFHEACDIIGLDQGYRSASGDLPQGVRPAETADTLTEDGRRFVEKIRKLLSLAQSSNEYEANLAMAKAGLLMDKYNLREESLQHESGYSNVIINHGRKRLERHSRQIARILKDFFYVDIVYSSLYDPGTDTEHKIIDIMGKRENVEVAEFVYHFLERKIRLLWEENRGKFGGNRLRARNSYFYGLLEGFHRKLEKQDIRHKKNIDRRSPETTASEIAVAKDKMLNAFVRMRYPRLRKYSRKGGTIYLESYAKGLADGKKIVLNNPISSRKGASGLAIEKA